MFVNAFSFGSEKIKDIKAYVFIFIRRRSLAVQTMT